MFLAPVTPYLAGAVGTDHLEHWFGLLRVDRPKWFHDAARAYFATDGTGSWVSQALVDDGDPNQFAMSFEPGDWRGGHHTSGSSTGPFSGAGAAIAGVVSR